MFWEWSLPGALVTFTQEQRLLNCLILNGFWLSQANEENLGILGWKGFKNVVEEKGFSQALCWEAYLE